MPSPSDLANLFAWYDSTVGLYDATSGGSPVTADGASIALWEDQSGNGRNLTQATSGNRPKLDATKDLVVGAGPDNYWLNCPALFTLDRQDFSIFFVCELENLRRPMNGGSVHSFHFFTQATSDALNLHYGGTTLANKLKLAGYDGSFHVSTTVPYTTELALVGFVGTATGLKCWLDGSYSSATALISGNATLARFLGSTASGVLQAGVKDIIVYSRAVSDSEVTNTLLPYAVSRGVASSREHQVIFEGDSLTHGYHATLNRNWPSKLTSIPSKVRRRVTAESGITLATLSSESATLIDPLFVSGQTNVLCVWAGTNDMAAGTAEETVYNTLVTYCTNRRNAGFKVLVFTCIQRNGADRNTFNNSIRTNWETFADGLVDVAADSRLDDSSDTTYFNADGVHLTDAGYAVVAELAEPEIESLLPAGGGVTVPPLAMHYYRMRRAS